MDCLQELQQEQLFFGESHKWGWFSGKMVNSTVKINTGSAVSQISTLCRLLQSAPANMDGMDLATLISSGPRK